MNYDMLIAGAIGIAPALALMYWTMKDYTYPKVEKPFFDDRKLFPMLAIGMIVGVVLYSIQSIFPMYFVLYALLFAVIEELVKLVILNFRRFQKHLDTPFYGLVLGLGIGSMMAFGAVYQFIMAITGEGDTLNARDYSIMIFLAIQFCLLNGATGTIIGVGSARGLPFGYFAQAVLVHLAFNLIMIGFFTFGSPWMYVAFAAAMVVAAFSYYQITVQTLPELISSEIKKFEKRTKG